MPPKSAVPYEAPKRILPAQFMQVSKEIRDYLSQMWKISRSGITEIRDQEVLSDGHTIEDLKVITHELMTEYIGSKESFLRAWEITVAKAYSELHPPVGEIKSTGENIHVEPVTEPVDKSAKIKHHAKA